MKLTAYFSATGKTAQLAKRIAEAAGTDLYEIVPERPYTKADLLWINPFSRSSKEMKDKSSRPAIKGKITDIDKYDTIYLGFPIWWYVAPTIINTFLESYDLSGKKIIPFATSGSSGMGKTNDALKTSCPDSELLDGRVLNRVSDDELKKWIEENK
ncbi:MAG: flavodoxin [Ruminococcus sp.]|nr:flavodoxin [Ruminococcus sp.]